MQRLGTVRLALALAVISDSNDILINAHLKFNDVMILACVSAAMSLSSLLPGTVCM